VLAELVGFRWQLTKDDDDTQCVGLISTEATAYSSQTSGFDRSLKWSAIQGRQRLR